MLKQSYSEWNIRDNQIQIAIVTFITAILYVIYSFLDRHLLQGDLLSYATTLHLYVLPPILLFISISAFFKKYCNFIRVFLLVSPILAAIGNLLLVVNLPSLSSYHSEVYLIIFWTFTVSGLKLFHASISAGIIFFITLFVSFYLKLSDSEFLMHIFWMFSSLSFGFAGAYLLEKSNKELFFKHTQLQQLAITDKLTGLYNRAKLDELLNYELEISKRYKQQTGILMIDIDYFKNINDTYGHQVGDEVLIAFSNILKENIRSTDIAVRWGGEEFIVICPQTTSDNLLILAKNLHIKIQNYNFTNAGKQTASIGLAVSNDSDDTESLINRADNLLYKAKENGRNHIETL